MTVSRSSAQYYNKSGGGWGDKEEEGLMETERSSRLPLSFTNCNLPTWDKVLVLIALVFKSVVPERSDSPIPPQPLIGRCGVGCGVSLVSVERGYCWNQYQNFLLHAFCIWGCRLHNTVHISMQITQLLYIVQYNLLECVGGVLRMYKN